METFAVVTACDDKFAQHTSVMLRSLLENNPKTTFRIFVLVPSDFPTNIQSMITNSMPSGTYSLTFIQVRYQGLSALKIWGWVSHTAYYRLMIADLLPEISRALYLDSDIVVMGDISGMLHLDLSQYPLAAALDAFDASPLFKRKISLGQSVPYFNSGVMLLNLDRWRSENIGRRALDFAATNPQYIVYWDQCALNNIIRGNFLVLPKEWNFQRADVDFDVTNSKSIERAKRAKVLHFTTNDKPWFFRSTHPLKGEYWKYLQRTEWKHYVEPDITFKRMVLNALRSHLPSFSPSVERIYTSIKNHGRIWNSPDAPWEASPLGKHLQEYTNFYLSKNTILGSHLEHIQRKIKEEMYGSVAAIFSADNPFLKCREKLAEYVTSFADWEVLCLKPEDKADESLSPYISGELYYHIWQCAQNNDELKEIIAHDDNWPDDALIDYAKARSCAYHYLMNCVNVVRADVNDFDHATATKADWFRPFVKSMLIWKEDVYRSKIGLPTLLPNWELARVHSSFFTCVLNGARDPLSHWEAIHSLKHSDVS
jgi:lipopolysaccharide biosynthesis glycosyltransferase